jgi:site-specific DNA-methyltransferase (adenine-specific)
MDANTLYYGDNLDILRRHIKDESVDLVYLDPPFNSNADYNVLFAEHDGTRAAAQIKVFEDTWTWDQGAARTYQEVVEAGGKVSQAMQAFRTFLGENTMMAYLAMMAPRLIELRRVLKPTGSIYLHCDPTASHYLKMLMDAVFGPTNCRNEIIWHYGQRTDFYKRHFSRKHDSILFYAKSKQATISCVSTPWLREDFLKHRHDVKVDEHGREFIWADGGKPGVRYPRLVEEVLAEGKPLDTVWDLPLLNSAAKERLNYPTQKPEALLERIIKASSDEGGTVLDPFCGCGTAIAVAQKLNRQWIGIDITSLATALIKTRLRDAFGDQLKDCYSVIGEPTSVPDAKNLAKEDPYQFQWWALGLVGARPVEQKKGADQGIDGRLYFHDDVESAKTKQIIFSVKAGHTNVTHLRDLRGVLDRESAEIGVLIAMNSPTKPMRIEAAGAGFYDSRWGRHPRLQILTIQELLGGKPVDCPPSNVTFKKAPKHQINTATDSPLDALGEGPPIPNGIQRTGAP